MEAFLTAEMICRANRCARILAIPLAMTAPRLVVAQTDSLDTPLKKQVMEFGPSPYYPSANVPIKLYCYLYASFMVKVYDEGQKGAEWLAIVPVSRRTALRCTKKPTPRAKKLS